MGLFSKLKKLRLKDIGTGKNLKKVGQGLRQMKFGEGLGLLGLGFGGAGLLGQGPLGGSLGGFGKAGFSKLFGETVGVDTGTDMMEQFVPGLLNNPKAMEFYKEQGRGLLGNVIQGSPISPMMNNPQLQQLMPIMGQQLQENFQSAVNPNYIGQTYENPMAPQQVGGYSMASQQAGGYQDNIFNMLNKIQ